MQGKFGMGGGGSGGLGSTSIKVSKPIATSSAGSSPATVSIKRPPNIPAVVRTSQSSVGQPSKPVIKLSTSQYTISIYYQMSLRPWFGIQMTVCLPQNSGGGGFLNTN